MLMDVSVGVTVLKDVTSLRRKLTSINLQNNVV